MTDQPDEFAAVAEPEKAVLDEALAAGDLAAVDEFAPAKEPERVVSPEVIAESDKVEVSVLPISEPDHYVEDAELQLELDRVMPGARVLQRTTQTTVTDVFINGGNYAPGQSRWVQTPTLSTAAKQAAIIKEIYG